MFAQVDRIKFLMTYTSKQKLNLLYLHSQPLVFPTKIIQPRVFKQFLNFMLNAFFAVTDEDGHNYHHLSRNSLSHLLVFLFALTLCNEDKLPLDHRAATDRRKYPPFTDI